MTIATNIAAILAEINQAEKTRCLFATGILRVSLHQLEENILRLQAHAEQQKQSPVRVLLPIKANAYGSGMIAVARFVAAKKLCAYLGVAHTSEAVTLRQNGVQTPILIMGQVQQSKEELDCIVNSDIELTISDTNILHALEERAAVNDKIARIHLEVDTGMGRCGVLYENLSPILTNIRNCEHLELVGVMTHFAVADSVAKDEIAYTKEQIHKFGMVKQEVLRTFPNEDIVFHTSNSGGCLEHTGCIFDMIRPGIAAYGYPERDIGVALQPIMDFVSTITLIKAYPKGHSIGYGCSYQTTAENELIGIVPIGYGDGLSRLLSNNLTPIINGKKVRSVGRISMDQFAVLVDQKTKVGDKVIIIGASNGVKNDASDMAKAANTIPYEVICNLGNASRIRHEYTY